MLPGRTLTLTISARASPFPPGAVGIFPSPLTSTLSCREPRLASWLAARCTLPRFSQTTPLVSRLMQGFLVPSPPSPGCATPITVTLPTSFSGPPSRSFTIVPQVNVVPCALANQYKPTFLWTISPAPGTIPSTYSTAAITIAAGTLGVGVYTATLSVAIPSLSTFNASTTITIVGVAPVVVISPAASVFTISPDHDFTLDASGSYDPNAVSGATSPLSFVWTCAFLTGNATCDPDLITPSTVLFAANTLPLNETVYIQLVVTSNLSGASTMVIIELNTIAVVVAQLQLTVVGISPAGYVNGNNPVRILGTITRSPSANPNVLLTLTWESVAGSSLQTIDLTSTNLLSPNNTFNLVIRPGVLLSGNPYTFRFNATNSAGMGSSSISFSVYPSPTGGLLTVSPTEGYAFETQFIFSALFWRQALFFSFFSCCSSIFFLLNIFFFFFFPLSHLVILLEWHLLSCCTTLLCRSLETPRSS